MTANRITPLISIGDIFDGRDVDPLVYGAVLNLSNMNPADYVRKEGVIYEYRYFNDGEPIPELDIERGIFFLHDMELRQKRTLVHCAAGVSRAPSIVWGYLVHSGSMGPIGAMAAIRAGRPQAQPHPDVLNSVEAYVWKRIARI